MHRFTLLLVLALLSFFVAAPMNLSAQDADEESPLLVEPKTAEACFDAAVLMIDLANPKLARQYLARLFSLNPDDAAILRMRDKHGPAMFLKLAGIRTLKPLSTRLLTRMNDAFRQRANDPARVDTLIADLGGTTQKRNVAIIQLRSAGPRVLPRILQRIESAVQPERDQLVFALSRLGKQVLPAMRGALYSPDPDMRATVIDAIGQLGSDRDVPYLSFWAYSEAEPTGVRAAARRALARIKFGNPARIGELTGYGVAKSLQRAARDHFYQKTEWQLQEDGTVDFWTWDTTANLLTSVSTTPANASLLVGARFARQAMLLAPEDTNAQALYMGIMLARDVYRSDWASSIPTGPGTAHNTALVAGEDTMLDVLRMALDNPDPAAALASLQVLGQVASRNQLYQGLDKSPLVLALDYPDQRVQFMAATTVLQLEPNAPFRGSRRVVEILQRGLTDNGTRRALVIDANSQRANTLADLAGTLGFDPITAATGQDGFRIASERGDIELIMIEANVARWPLSQTLANLRADARTARLPIAVFGLEKFQDKLDRAVSRYKRTVFFVEPKSPATMKAAVTPLLQQITTPALTDVQRDERIEAAAFWFGHISANARRKVFDISTAERALFQAVNDPKLAGSVIYALASIPSQSAQQRLKEISANDTLEADFRQTSAVQLAFHIQRFGLLLTKTEVEETRSAWQKTTEPGLKTALASVIGSLNPTRRRVSEVLSNFPEPRADLPQPMPAN
ncbi:MAG: hypothetical protein CMJ78_08385 [Planctomycetaceae bacterium]|nr:hypothetical protein [Planctomycetaceae bacterium]